MQSLVHFLTQYFIFKNLICNGFILNFTTIIITFRINKKYDNYLRKKAEQERVSVNIIVNRIFGEYIEWQQHL